jgi:CheY-like chemotaxis protein
MKLNYKIIWVEDKINERPFQKSINAIKKFLSEKFFDVQFETAEDFESFQTIFNQNDSFDLIITDYSLNDSHGNQVIDFIRMDKNILTEVFFYSANPDLRNIPLANSSRISFYTLEGVGYHNRLLSKIEELIALTISKFEHIVSMRGMIMHETCSLDLQMLDIISKALISPKVNFDELAVKIYDDLNNLYKAKNDLVNDCRDKGKFKNLTKDQFVFSADYKIRTLGQILNSIKIDDYSEEYKEEINSIRNKFAHAVLMHDNATGRDYFKYKEEGITFDEELCKKIRKDIIKHKKNFDYTIRVLEAE